MVSDRESELIADRLPTPHAISLCQSLCEEKLAKERCLPINVVVADVRRYVRDPLVKKAVMAQFDDDNADIFDVVLCEPGSAHNTWTKAILPPSAHADVYKARIRRGTLIRLERVKLHLKQHKNNSATSNIIVILDMSVLRQDYDVGLSEDLMDEATRTRLYTPLLESRLYYISMYNSTDVLPDDPKWKFELETERPKTIQVSNFDEILQHGVKKKLTIYGRVVAKTHLMHHATMDTKHLAPIRGSFTIAGIAHSDTAESLPGTKMRVVLWDVAAMKYYRGIRLGSVVSIDGYRLKPIYSASKKEEESDMCGMEVSVNSSTPTGQVRVIPPNPASKNITKFLERFPTPKYRFAWPTETPRSVYSHCDLIGLLLYVGRPLVVVHRDNHNVLKPSQYRWLQLRHPKEPTRTVSIQLFSLSNPTVWDNLLPGQLFACTCMRLEQRNSRKPNTTTKSLHIRGYYVNTTDTQIHVRENKIFESKDVSAGLKSPVSHNGASSIVSKSTTGSPAKETDGINRESITKDTSRAEPKLAKAKANVDSVGARFPEGELDSEEQSSNVRSRYTNGKGDTAESRTSPRAVPRRRTRERSVSDTEKGDEGTSRTHKHRRTEAVPGEQRRSKRQREKREKTKQIEKGKEKLDSPNRKHSHRKGHEHKESNSTRTSPSKRKRAHHKDQHHHKRGAHPEHPKHEVDHADIFTTREGRAVLRWSETDVAKALVTRALCGGRYIPIPLPLRYEWYCSDRKTLDGHDPDYDLTPMDEMIQSTRYLRYQECRRFVVRGTIIKLELCTSSGVSRPSTACLEQRNKSWKSQRLSDCCNQSQGQGQGVRPSLHKERSPGHSQSMSSTQDSTAGAHKHVLASLKVPGRRICANHLSTSTDTVLPDLRKPDDGNGRVMDPSVGYYWVFTVQTLSHVPQAASIEMVVSLTIEQMQQLLDQEPIGKVCGPNPMSWIVDALPPDTLNEETVAAIARCTNIDDVSPAAKEYIGSQLADKRMMFVVECYQGLSELPEISMTKAYALQLVLDGAVEI